MDVRIKHEFVRAINFRTWPTVTEYSRCIIQQYGDQFKSTDEYREVLKFFISTRCSWF